MAFESYYWRNIIKKDIKYLRKKVSFTHEQIGNNIDEHFSYVEIKIMTLAYIARKLADSDKLPDRTLNKKIPLLFFSATGDYKRAYLDFEREYDLNNSKTTRLTIREICNQIIHAYFLQVIGNKNRPFKYIWFVSDKNRKVGLYQLPITTFLKIMEKIAASYVTKLSTHYGKTTDKRIVVRK